MKIKLEDFKVTTKYMVHWGEMDAALHVNNLVYLRWFESARIYYFEQMIEDVSFAKLAPILAWQDCKYVFPMTYPDTAIVAMRTLEVLEDRFVMQSAVFSERHQRLAAFGQQTIIPYDYRKLAKVALPDEWISGIEGLEE